MSFTLDMASAILADVGAGSEKIQEAGCYTGEITQCWEEISQNGSVGFKFNFRRDDGAEAKHITMWHEDAAGKKNFNINKINALMFLLKLRAVTKKQGKIKKFDPELKKETDQIVNIFPEFFGKKIGLCLGVDFYNDKVKMVLDHSFDPVTKQTAGEMIEKKPAEIVEKMIHRYQKQPKKQVEKPAAESASSINFDDDIPF
jgi:hypothetical protein